MTFRPVLFFSFFCALQYLYVALTLQITVKAGKDIAEGEHIATMYTHALWGTIARYTAPPPLPLAATVADSIQMVKRKTLASPQLFGCVKYCQTIPLTYILPMLAPPANETLS
jgi:hypothetical protein